MSLPTYSECKDSLVDGLGSVPTHWQLKRLGNLCSLIQTGPFGSQLHSEDYIDDGTPVVNPSNIQNGAVVPDWGCTVSDDVADELAHHKLRDGDIIFGRRGEMGRCALIRPENIGWLCGTGSLIVRLSGINPEFGAVYLATSFVKQWLSLKSVGSTMDNLNASILAAVPIPVPPEHEQVAITAFLDRETRKIDALIGKQEKLLALLAEKRQATISHAVTRGLDRDVPMIDCGVAWLGAVPAHWQVSPLKYLVSLKSGGTPSKENLEFWNGDVPWASAKDLKSERLADTIDHITTLAVESGNASLVPAGTVLVVVRGMILARIFPVVETVVPMAINQDLKGVIPLDGLNSQFLAWLLRGSADESLLRLDEAGHGTKALRMDAWSSMQLPVPPIDEQSEIAAFLESETGKLDALKVETERAIDLLRERRSALISAAVTGKIDVRNAATRELAA
ncbi:restriction endonuclease subunit S [Paraburkholderia atlantica]|uniref:restriction endonuclease subunit S n=1 Tax=Paraburkholderia atlantica TaxID=2654982 RepID=UPI001607F3E5|nr:restriction endonuclease subunit S [Paraburkholderia atlantica]MBB5417076.1 type I restriction enzyme S subunit [Paraburkholderia atlantica]